MVFGNGVKNMQAAVYNGALRCKCTYGILLTRAANLWENVDKKQKFYDSDNFFNTTS